MTYTFTKVTFHPLAPPTLSAPSTVYAVNDGVNATLVVMVMDAKPRVEIPQVTWSREGSDDIDLGLSRYTADVSEGVVRLIITSPTHSDSSSYTLRIQHPAGTVSASITLTVLGKNDLV